MNRRAAPALSDVRLLVARAFPNERASLGAVLDGGLSNASFRFRLASLGDIVVRVHLGPRAVSRLEAAIVSRLRGSVPVPEILFCDHDASPNPFIVYRYVPGITFRELKRSGDREALADASDAVGAILARLASFTLPGSPRRPKSWRAALEGCADSSLFEHRIGVRATQRLREVVEAWGSRMSALEASPSLVHGDFSRANILLRHDAGVWSVAAILDWERAFGGSQLYDIGHFLRYEDDRTPLLEPHFSRGFTTAGGALPADWRRSARIADLVALAEGLTKRDLPPDAVVELRDLVFATLESAGVRANAPRRRSKTPSRAR